MGISDQTVEKLRKLCESRGIDTVYLFGSYAGNEADSAGDLYLAKARRVEQEQRRVNVDFPIWTIHSLDKEAKGLGIPRQSLIKMPIARNIEQIRE